MKAHFIILLLALVVLSACSSQVAQNDDVSEVPVVEEPVLDTEEDTVPPSEEVDGYSLADVALHDSAESCWTVIRDDVYDLTDWIAQHPGGPSAITRLCGVDGTELFVNQHGGRDQQENQLLEFKIGSLRE